MLYVEYRAQIQGLEKRLGVVGETHIYTAQENRLARGLIQTYRTVAYEGGNKITAGNLLSALTLVPAFAVNLANSKSRSFANKNMAELMKEYGRTCIRLEEGTSLPALVSAYIAYGGLVGTVKMLSPAYRATMQKKFDARQNIKEVEEELGKDLQQPHSTAKEMPARIRELVIDRRDEIMANRAINTLNQPGNNDLLIAVGLAHIPGVLRRLKEAYDLREIFRGTDQEIGITREQ